MTRISKAGNVRLGNGGNRTHAAQVKRLNPASALPAKPRGRYVSVSTYPRMGTPHGTIPDFESGSLPCGPACSVRASTGRAGWAGYHVHYILRPTPKRLRFSDRLPPSLGTSASACQAGTGQAGEYSPPLEENMDTTRQCPLSIHFPAAAMSRLSRPTHALQMPAQ